MNVVVLAGRLARDPELRTSAGGVPFCNFTVAVDRDYVKPGEERKADFIRCVAWRQNAEFVHRYFTKGKWIGVQGSIQTGSYQNKDGATVYTTDVMVDSVSFIGNKDSGSGSTGGSENYRSSGYVSSTPSREPRPERRNEQPSYSSGSNDDFVPTPLDTDLPF